MSKLNKTEHGTVTYADPGADRPVIELVTHQCVHCGGHFISKPKGLISEVLTTEEAKKRELEGKRVRGWCMACHGPICGPGCASCVPVEQYLENIERNRPANFRPIMASVPQNFQ